MGAENYTSIGGRLREEWDRLLLAQDAFAEKCGVTVERSLPGRRVISFPKAQALPMAASEGVDVLYVVTGRHLWEVQGTSMDAFLTPEEARLLADYRSSNEQGRAAAGLVLSALAQRG